MADAIHPCLARLSRRAARETEHRQRHEDFAFHRHSSRVWDAIVGLSGYILVGFRVLACDVGDEIVIAGPTSGAAWSVALALLVIALDPSGPSLARKPAE